MPNHTTKSNSEKGLIMRERERERERERVTSRSEIFSFSNLLKAYYQCRKTKRKSSSAAEFEINFEKELLEMSLQLKNRSYQPGKYTCFAITDPKIREVWAADFRDRIIHHLLINYLEPIWEKKFIFHSYACRSEKGAHKAIYNLKKQILQPISHGIDFLGYVTRPDYILSRKRVVVNLKKKLFYFNKIINPKISPQPEKNNKQELPLLFHNKIPALDFILEAQAVINSYCGHFKHANCLQLRKKLYFNYFKELKNFLEPADKEFSHFIIPKNIKKLF